jgi:hypothetical protein
MSHDADALDLVRELSVTSAWHSIETTRSGLTSSAAAPPAPRENLT